MSIVPGARQKDVTTTRALQRAVARCQERGCPWPPDNLPVKGDTDQSYAKNVRYAAREHAIRWPGHVISVDVVDHTEYVYGVDDVTP